MTKLRSATLVFLIKRNTQNEIIEICLAMKKRGFGINRFNGVGGKVKEGIETIEEASIREAREEIKVSIQKMKKVAELSFYFNQQADFNQMVHVYLADEWSDQPSESEEMSPYWFPIEQIPYPQMWPDDIFWLPHIIKGKLIKACFTFGEKDIILNKQVSIVEHF